MGKSLAFENDDLNLKATELKLGLPGSDEPEKQSAAPTVRSNKRAFSPEISEKESKSSTNSSASDAAVDAEAATAAKAQVVGWPPVRSNRKNNLLQKKNEADINGAGMYVKVSVDGAPYLRKIDLKVYKSYQEFLKALEKMFKLRIGEFSERDGYNGSDYAPTYEDKDGDWMLVGDVPWDMFISTCKRLRIMRGSEARGLTSL